MEVPRLGVQWELQLPASTTATATATATRDLSLSVAYPAAHGYAGSLTHGARPGIEPTFSWTVVGLLLLSPSRKSGVFHFKLEKLSFRKRVGICQGGRICPPAMLLLGPHRLFPSWAAVLTQECLRCVFSLCAAHSPSRHILCGTQARGCAREDVCPLSTRAALAPEWPTGRGRSSSEPQYRKRSVGSSGEVGAPCVSWAGPGHSRAFHADLGPCWVTSRRLCLKLSIRGICSGPGHGHGAALGAQPPSFHTQPCLGRRRPAEGRGGLRRIAQCRPRVLRGPVASTHLEFKMVLLCLEDRPCPRKPPAESEPCRREKGGSVWWWVQ